MTRISLMGGVALEWAISATVVSGVEGLLFRPCVVGAMILARRSMNGNG